MSSLMDLKLVVRPFSDLNVVGGNIETDVSRFTYKGGSILDVDSDLMLAVSKMSDVCTLNRIFIENPSKTMAQDINDGVYKGIDGKTMKDCRQYVGCITDIFGDCSEMSLIDVLNKLFDRHYELLMENAGLSEIAEMYYNLMQGQG